MTIAERDGVVLRTATAEDLSAIDALTVEGYAAIQESYVSMLGEELYAAVRHRPELSWEERKCAQNRDLFAAHPDQVWVLDREGDVFGYVTFWLFPDQQYGHIDNNAVRRADAGHGWATFMYRCVLERFRELGLRFAHVDTGLDEAHSPARRAYEAVGFDRAVPGVEYWQDLLQPAARAHVRPRPVHHVAAAIVRRGDEVVLVLQGAPGEEPFWSLPGGVVDDGELVPEALVREVREEAGLAVELPARLAFVRQVDSREPVQLIGRRPGVGFLLTVWVFEADTWSGEVAAGDPDGFVTEARFVPVADAVERLRRTSWLEIVADYLEGKVEPGSLHFERQHEDGRIEVIP